MQNETKQTKENFSLLDALRVIVDINNLHRSDQGLCSLLLGWERRPLRRLVHRASALPLVSES